MSKAFIDTNVLVYANDQRDARKQETAIALVECLLRDGSGVISTQVLQEYVVTARARLGLDADVILRQVAVLETLEFVVVTPPLIRRAVEIAARYQLNYWDAAIVAAAELARCARIVSEDFSHDTLYAGIRVENPFAAASPDK